MKRDVLLAIALSLSHFLSLKEKLFLYSTIDSIDNLRLLSIKELSDILNRTCRSKSWSGASVVKEAEKALFIAKKMGIIPILFFDAEYPSLLHEIVDSPFVLFCRGALEVLASDCISVVGTRRLTAEGKKAAFDFAAEAANDGVCVISGLAYGTDAAAHEGALSVHGKTVAVLPSGIDTIVPHSHIRLAQKILTNGGCLMSEYVPGVGAEPWRYVQRNRIIAGLSPATLVVQAPPGSGALITADFALSYDRDVLFHQVCFETNAKLVSEEVRKQLAVSVAHGEKKRYKLENVPENYVRDGAPVIQNYADYVRCLTEMPGSRMNELVDTQLRLF